MMLAHNFNETFWHATVCVSYLMLCVCMYVNIICVIINYVFFF